MLSGKQSSLPRRRGKKNHLHVRSATAIKSLTLPGRRAGVREDRGDPDEALEVPDRAEADGEEDTGTRRTVNTIRRFNCHDETNSFHGDVPQDEKSRMLGRSGGHRSQSLGLSYYKEKK